MLIRLLANTLGQLARNAAGPSAIQYYWSWIRAIGFVWVLSQGIVNVARFATVYGNLQSTAMDINRLGAEGFASRFSDMMSLRGVDLDKNDIEVSLDSLGERYSISAPFTWSFNFLFWKFELQDSLTALTVRFPNAASE